MSKLVLENVSSPRGAPMGRRDQLPDDTTKPVKLRLERLRWVDGDYDSGGAYWGHTPGATIFCAWNDDGVRMYTRAASRSDAKANFISLVGGARFYK